MRSLKEKYHLPTKNEFYRDHYHHVIIFLMGAILLLIAAVILILYLLTHRPQPNYYAAQPNGQRMLLTPAFEPNLLPTTILRWAIEAATAAYTFDFVNYNKQIAAVRHYFTDTGWQGYLNSVNDLITTIEQNQLFVTGVVSGTPVISNQGQFTTDTYGWRIQIPFIVTYQSANAISKRNFYVILTVVRVNTAFNPQGIGIDQFVMTSQI